MLQSIVDEMVAYNPAAGAVFGVEFVRLTGLYITTGDLGWTTSELQVATPPGDAWAVDAQGSQPRWMPQPPEPSGPAVLDGRAAGSVSGEIGRKPAETLKGPAVVAPPPSPEPAKQTDGARKPATSVGRESGSRPTVTAAVPPPPAINATPSTPAPIPRSNAKSETLPPPVGGAAGSPPPPMPAVTPPASATAAMAEPAKKRSTLPSVPPPPIPASPASGAGSSPSLAAIAITPRPRTTTAPGAVPVPVAAAPTEASGEIVPKKRAATDGGSAPVMGIGMGAIGIGGIGVARPTTDPPPPAAKPAPEDPDKLEKGAQVRVAGPDGRLVAAIVKQELSGYCELEIGGSNEIMWVPRASVVTE
jgi:hypothetical protein